MGLTNEIKRWVKWVMCQFLRQVHVPSFFFFAFHFVHVPTLLRSCFNISSSPHLPPPIPTPRIFFPLRVAGTKPSHFIHVISNFPTFGPLFLCHSKMMMCKWYWLHFFFIELINKKRRLLFRDKNQNHLKKGRGLNLK